MDLECKTSRVLGDQRVIASGDLGTHSFQAKGTVRSIRDSLTHQLSITRGIALRPLCLKAAQNASILEDVKATRKRQSCQN